MKSKDIIAKLPYVDPFLFVDEIDEIQNDYIVGHYTFKEDAFFYKGHFKDHPVTPGVILTECMAQIGLVSLGIYKLQDQDMSTLQVAFTSADVAFLKPVYPSQKVTVISKETYFRFNKLKCDVVLKDQHNEVCAKGSLAGIFKIT